MNKKPPQELVAGQGAQILSDSLSSGPLHHQIREDLTLRIRSGHWLPGQEFPSETDLCKYYEVSRGTIRQSLTDLVSLGLLERHRGRATSVRRPKLEGSILATYQDSIKRPHDAGSKVLSCNIVKASGDIARMMKIDEGTEIYILERARFVNDEPLSYQTSYMPSTLCPGLEECDLESFHLHEILEKQYDVSFLRADEFVEPVKADDYVAKLLNIEPAEAIFYIERLSYLFSGAVGEFRRAYMRGDRYRYHIVLR